jgi:hypothetical protein
MSESPVGLEPTTLPALLLSPLERTRSIHLSYGDHQKRGASTPFFSDLSI